MSETIWENGLMKITTLFGEDFLLLNRLRDVEEISSLLSFGIPEFVKKALRKINDARLGLPEEIYARLTASGAAEPSFSDYPARGDRFVAAAIRLI